MAYASGTFTPNVAKRNSAGPFAAGTMVQGAYSSATDNTYPHDILSLPSIASQTLISGLFYSLLDRNQGSIVFWVTPEWSSGPGTGTHTFYSNHNWLRVYHSNSSMCLDLAYGRGGCTSVTLTAGSTYLVVARWDIKNTLDGSKYISLSVNNATTFYDTTAASGSISGNVTVGGEAHGSWTGQYPANAIIDGLAIYRRVLYDGTYGTNVGNGNELSLIYNGSTGQDPTLITGSWDVVFALPTNATIGALATGTGNAWSHPYSSNLLYTSTTNTGGFMMNGTYGTDGWTNVGSPTSVGALATSEKIYSGGYKYTSTGANQGIQRSFSATNGGDYVLRALGHSDGTCSPRVQVARADGTTEINKLDGTTTSTLGSPNVYIFAWEAPAAENNIVKLINTASSGTCYWHQVEVLANLENAPSFETGSGDPWIPTSWENWSVPAGGSSQETTIVHSGASSFRYNGGFGGNVNENSGGSQGDYISYGVFMYGTAGTLAQHVSDYYLQYLSGTVIYGNQAGNKVFNTVTNQWEHVKSVRNKRNTDWQRYFLDRSSSSITGYFDDIYAFLLSAVSLTITPANTTNSTESSGLRVDGADTNTQTISNLSTTAGTINFTFTPRHSFSTAGSFGVTSPVIFEAYTDANNYMKLYKSGTALVLDMMGSGVLRTASWSNPTLNANTSYAFSVSYISGGDLTLTVDSVSKATGTPVSALTSVPSTIYWGSDRSGINQYEGTFR